MAFNWLMFAHFKNPKERENCFKHLKGTIVEPGVTVYVFMFGPYVNSPVHHVLVTSTGAQYLGVIESLANVEGRGYYTKFVPKVKKIVSSFVDRNIKIHGIDVYAHSSGLLIGGWYNYKHFLTVMDFTDHVLEPLKPLVVVFDSCYMGVVSALYEMSRVKSIKYVMASPTYHPSYSVLETDAFGKVGTLSHDKATLSKQLRQISCAFQNLTYPSYRCFLLIDLQKVPRFVKELKKVGPSMLKFDKTTQLHKADPTTHDIWRASTHSHLRKMIKAVSRETCGLKHCKVARGISIEIEFPDAHRGLYKKTRWYKEMKGLLYE